MTNIIYNETIIVKKDTTFFSFEVEEDNRLFLESLNETNIRNFKDKDTDFDISFNVFFNEIIKLSDYLERKENMLHYNEALQMIENVGNQMKYIENNGVTVPVINNDDIIVCKKDDDICILMINFENSKIINDEDKIEIDYPIQKTKYFSLEHNNILELPKQIDKRSWIYSLGLLTIDCLTNNLDYKDLENVYREIKSIEQIKERNKRIKEYFFDIIRSIERTKLYHCIMRTIEYEPTNRALLIV